MAARVRASDGRQAVDRPSVIRAVRRRIPAVFATEAPLGLLVRARRSPSVHRLERRPRDRPHCRSTGLAPVGVRRDRDHVLENPARRRTHRRRDRARPRSGPQRPQRGRRHRQLRTDRPRRRRRRTVAGDDQATHLPSTTRAGRSRAPPVPGRRVRRRDGAADHAPLERSGQGARRDPSGLAPSGDLVLRTARPDDVLAAALLPRGRPTPVGDVGARRGDAPAPSVSPPTSRPANGTAATAISAPSRTSTVACGSPSPSERPRPARHEAVSSFCGREQALHRPVPFPRTPSGAQLLQSGPAVTRRRPRARCRRGRGRWRRSRSACRERA